MTQLEAKSPLLGLFDGLLFAQESIQLEPGDKVLFYTDAISEVMRAGGEMLGVEGLAAYLERHRGLGIEALVEQVYHYGLTFGGRDSYEDDFSMVGLAFVGQG